MNNFPIFQTVLTPQSLSSNHLLSLSSNNVTHESLYIIEHNDSTFLNTSKLYKQQPLPRTPNYKTWIYFSHALPYLIYPKLNLLTKTTIKFRALHLIKSYIPLAFQTTTNEIEFPPKDHTRQV